MPRRGAEGGACGGAKRGAKGSRWGAKGSRGAQPLFAPRFDVLLPELLPSAPRAPPSPPKHISTSALDARSKQREPHACKPLLPSPARPPAFSPASPPVAPASRSHLLSFTTSLASLAAPDCAVPPSQDLLKALFKTFCEAWAQPLWLFSVHLESSPARGLRGEARAG